MKQLCFSLMAFLLLTAHGAWANTDYTCLKECTHNSGNASSCMGKCSYSSTPVAGGGHYQCFSKCISGGTAPSECMPQCAKDDVKIPAKAKNYNPNVLAPVKNYDQILPETKPYKPAPDIDATCMRTCLAGHLQYQLCSQNCTK